MVITIAGTLRKRKRSTGAAGMKFMVAARSAARVLEPLAID
jgi:hypothetical protein